jgi:hypothetical protein
MVGCGRILRAVWLGSIHQGICLCFVLAELGFELKGLTLAGQFSYRSQPFLL